MADLTTTTEPSVSAWIVKRTSSAPRYSVRIGVGSTAHGAIEEGHWAVVLDDGGNVSEVGRILRIRSDLDGATIHFDHWHAIGPSVPLVDLGLTAPTGPAARLLWDDFLRVLPLLGVAKPGALPLIEDVVYVRDLLELAVRDDLLGPAGGPHELIKDMSVRDRYLVGKLAPRRPDEDEAPRVEPAAAADEIGDLEDERTAPIHEPGAEFASASGRVEPEDDALDEIDTTNNQSLVPSSMGLTFCVAPDVNSLAVEARWGRYERVPNDEHDVVKVRKNRETGKEEETKVKVWKRIPCGGVVSLPLTDGQIRPSTPDREQPDVRLQGTVRTNSKGERLVTLFLVNGQLEPEDNKDRAWLFQPEIAVTAPEGAQDKSVFRRRSSSEIIVDDPERDRLALIYRDRLEFAVGHGVSVHAATTPDDVAKAHHIRTEIIPRYEVAVTETPGLDPKDRPAMRRMVDQGWLDMSRLAEMESDELREALSCLIDDYALWIEEQRKRLETEITGFDDSGRDAIARCEETLRRLREGMGTLFSDDSALRAFRFANQSMALQRVRSLYALKRRRNEEVDVTTLDIPKNRSWRPFQLAFLLLSVPSLADPAHPDRTKPVEAFADLLWFPTGGGKTEAYLGVAAFAMAMRRLKNDLGELDASRGLAVIMRYTLRLLTLQQFQRATALLCAMEVIRRADEKIWGREPFSLGLWVGNRVTPGRTEDAHQAIEALRNGDRNRSGIASPAQLTSCPWCGSEISPGRDIEVDRIVGRTLIHCGDKLGRCDFSKARSNGQAHPGLPVKVVDEEIYHRPPTMMIATVDKFAMMAWRPEVRNLFGRVDQECERHGLLWPGHDCGTGHRARGAHPAAKVKPVRAIRPPDLIIQDEFHLISGPLGTMVGLYESAVDELSSWPLGETKVRPKVVASTATVRRAEDQVRNVFMRRISVFPPSGLDVEDNFFSVQRPIEEKPGRRYMGICAPGSSRPAVLIRTYTAFLTAAQALFDRFGPVADPYMTLVGYFNSLRELGGMKRLAEDDVQTRSFRVSMSLVDRPGLSQRRVDDVRELTSRVSSHDIPRYLDQLEVPFDGTFDPATGKWASSRNPGDPRPIDVVLATNMLSVGVDVNRLGVMVVNGQPKGTAEYIQATSRVGRTPPGLVATVLTWARPRDLSHYETFEHYHATFYQHVEAQSVTPFSPRALDRGLTGAMLSIMRHSYDPFAPNTGAGAMNSPSRSEMLETIRAVAARTWEVTEDSGKKALTEAELKSRADEWANEAGVGGRTLVYQKYGAGPTAYPLLEAPGVKPWTDWTVPMSMREVEPGVRLVMEDARSTNDPAWRARVTEADGDDL
ncbi:helicase [Afipia sp. P52-10]|uniref:DISARM system helicase DrmA n=1 Tax=Afipia sp. P52-10 TaxID=1429916 RepID=UPI0003DF3A2B|nr:DISARM system helicase DrmA [Afipia sp. P52-10]ETR77865.1 helicase [Afipia sp. P52-10]